jgi:S-disulfanyl-L-cysteine oxidoreductase SoxD
MDSGPLKTGTGLSIAVCGLCLSVAHSSVVAEMTQSSRTIWSGVYSAAQARRGESVAKSKCTRCHETDLAGGQDGPGLVGPEVVEAWSGMTLRDVFDRISTTMPADAPRSLGTEEVAAIVAYLLNLNKAPVGDNDLPTDMAELAEIRVTRTPQ